jgi:hypothetical protein
MQTTEASPIPGLGAIDSALTALKTDIEAAHALLASGDAETALDTLQRARTRARALAPAAPVAVAA